MKKLTFDGQQLIERLRDEILIFSLLCGVFMFTSMLWNLSDEANTAARLYSVTQNGTTYTGRIIRGSGYVKVTDKDDNMVILDAAHGPISIRRSDLMEHPIDVQHNPDTNL
jgi:hypothetical protein